MEISGRKIGDKYQPLVIAEIGINHNGSLNEALKIVDEAHKAGAEIVKHQTHIADDEMSSAAKNVIPGHTKDSIYDIIDSCSLSESEEYELMKYVKKKGMIFISTPFSRAAADRLNKFDIPAYKIGSGECNNYPLIEHVANFGKSDASVSWNGRSQPAFFGKSDASVSWNSRSQSQSPAGRLASICWQMR